MNREQIIRAWKDEDYRLGLSGEELSALPENPAGIVQLSDLEMGQVGGETGMGSIFCIIITATMDFICYPTMRCDTLMDCVSTQ